ncbi:MAG: MBL fold metallo-hydrolase [Candidatus Aenigmarchaeota archaeon]|nr:MBL fold metallo-hydrolase [Candidatus Aenigmarchaeota archaeon]
MKLKRMGDVTLIQLSDTDSNIYLVGDVVIDSGTGFNFPSMRYLFKMMKKNMDDVKLVLCTHTHFDHIGGARYFFESKIACSDVGVPVIEKADIDMSAADFYNGQLKPRKVDQVLKEGDKIKAGKYNLEVIRTPGHTDCSITLYDKAKKIAFTGDSVFADGIGSTEFINSNADELRKSLEKLSKMKIDRYFPGHGEPVEKQGAKRIETLLKEADKAEPVE